MPLFTPAPVVHPPYVAGNRYPLHAGGVTSSGAVAAVDIIYFQPFIIERPVSFSAFAIRVGTGGAGSSVKGGIWANSQVSSRPLGAPLFKDDTGAATTASSTTVTVATGAGTLGPGWYWFGSKYTGTLPTVAVINADNSSSWLFGVPSASNPYALWISYANAYANAMPTIAEGASFTVTNSNVCPIGYILAA